MAAASKSRTSRHDDNELFAVSLHPKVAEILREVHDTGLFGVTYPETLDRIVCDWILKNAERLRALGVRVGR